MLSDSPWEICREGYSGSLEDARVAGWEVGSYEREVGSTRVSEEHLLEFSTGVRQETPELLGGMDEFLELGSCGTLGGP